MAAYQCLELVGNRSMVLGSGRDGEGTRRASVSREKRNVHLVAGSVERRCEISQRLRRVTRTMQQEQSTATGARQRVPFRAGSDPAPSRCILRRILGIDRSRDAPSVQRREDDHSRGAKHEWDHVPVWCGID